MRLALRGIGWPARVAWLAGLWLGCGWPVQAAEPAVSAIRGVVDVPGDGFAAGELLDAPAEAGQPRQTLLWKARPFARPFEIRLDALDRVRFPMVVAAPSRPGDYRCELRGGDLFVGSLEALDGEQATIAVVGPDGPRPIRVRREWIERLVRVDAADAAATIVPGGLDGWEQATVGSWREEGGELVADQPGAVMFRDLKSPTAACYDIVVSWKGRPGFELSLAADRRLFVRAKLAAAGAGKPARGFDRYRLETLGDKLLAVREIADRVEMDEVCGMPADAGTLRLQAYVDRQGGRLAVVLPDRGGATVFDAVLRPAATKQGTGAGGGLQLLLRSGVVRLQRLSVAPWDGKTLRMDTEPGIAVRTGATAAANGATVESFAAGAREFVVRDGPTTRRIAEADLNAITFPKPAASGDDPVVALRATLAGGMRVGGHLVKVQEGRVWLDCPSLVEPLAWPLQRVLALESVAGRQAAAGGRGAGRIGMFASGDGSVLLPGWFVGAANPEEAAPGLMWQPSGCVDASPLDPASLSAVVTYATGDPPAEPEPRPDEQGRREAGRRPPLPQGETLFYLRNGDVIPCRLVAGDDAGLRITGGVIGVGSVVVPAGMVQAVDLVPDIVSFKLDREKTERLRTLPRMQRSDPPTHLLRARSGDFVRGKLLKLDDDSVRMSVQSEVREFPRDAITRVIALQVEGEASFPRATAGLEQLRGIPVQLVAASGLRLTLAAERVEGRMLVGRSPTLGACRVDLDTVDSMLIGDAIDAFAPASHPFRSWILKPAPDPRNAAPPPKPIGAAEHDAPVAADELTEEDPHGIERLEEARATAVAGDRRCLAALGELLSSSSLPVRRQSIGLLRRLTGLPAEQVPYGADAPAAVRERDAVQWRQWIARNGITATLSFPPRSADGPPASVAPAVGRTLLCRPQMGDVVEFDAAGVETFKRQVKAAWACQGLANGHRLIGSFGDKTITEYDAQGEPVWSVKSLPGGPMSVRRLDDGRTLAALSDANVVVEYDAGGTVVWEAALQGRPCDARRLENGRTLVALQQANRIVEVDRDGTVVWSVGNLQDVQTAQRLPNGNTLVALTAPGVVREIDDAGEAVWSKDGFKVAADAQRLADGRTLVVEQAGAVVELDRDGEELSRTPGGGSRVHRY